MPKKVLHLTVLGQIPSKKNSRVSAGRFTVAGPRYRAWEESAGFQLLAHQGKMLSGIDAQLEFWMPDNRARDLDNMVTSVFDMLKRSKIIKDDSWQCIPAFYARAAGIDKERPRCEIWLILI